MNYPTYIMINGKKYNINTDFRVAIECDKISRDNTIGDLERALAIIYKLYGKEGINTPEDYEMLLKMAKKYFNCNKEEQESNEEPDMDYTEDYDYIEASFMSDYHIDLSKEKMHWWKFYKLMCGLSNSEMGNCCILNRIRNIRNTNLSTIQDVNERSRMAKIKERVALKSTDEKYNLTEEQEESMNRFNEIIKRGEQNV